MGENIFIAVAASVCTAGVLLLAKCLRDMWDRRRVYQWLRENTRDEPGESHTDIATLAKGTCLPEDRARAACMTHKGIYRNARGPQEWSVWRQEPRSMYENPGNLSL